MYSPAPSSGPIRGPFAPILLADNNLLLLTRRLEPGTRAALQRAADGALFSHSTTIDSVSPNPAPLLASIAEPTARDFLAQDIALLVRYLGQVLQRRHLHARLSITRSDECRKLHSDNVTIRMLCTYAGPGTEWVPDADVVRENLSRIDVDVETANRSVLRRPDAVQHCRIGDVILLKGEAFTGNDGRGAVHRSPPIESRSLARLVLKVDEERCGC